MELRKDQLEDLGRLILNPKFILGNEPGTGKTPVICTLQRHLWEANQVATIWTMPLSLLKKNRDEALKWGGWSPDDVVIIHGTPAQVEEQMQEGGKLILMGFARFRMLMEAGLLPERFKAMHSDEHHKGFGGNDSSTTGALYKFMKEQGEYFVPMTGTIINGKLDTAYPALQIIDPRYYGNFKQFQAYHHEIDIWTGKRIGYRNHPYLKELLDYHGVYRKWSDIFGDEQKVVEIELVDMEPEQRTLYKKFERDAILELEQFFVDGTLPGVAFARARQIMEIPNEFPDLRFPGSKATVDIIPGRIPGKEERLDLHLTNHLENGTPFVIFSAVRRQQVRLFEQAKAMGLKVGILNGAVSSQLRSAQDEAFQAGHLQGIIASPKVADAGFNWQFWGPNKVEVQHCIYASLDYVDTTFFQSYRRFLRERRSTPLRISVLKYRDSLDFHIGDLINRKSADAHLVDPEREILRL